jgi:hypothetical protein
MRTTKRLFEQVASSIREMRGTVQNDLDRSYSVNGSIVLDQLTQRLADVFAANYPHFERGAFLNATQVPKGSGHLTESGCTQRRDPSGTETRSVASEQGTVRRGQAGSVVSPPRSS